MRNGEKDSEKTERKYRIIEIDREMIKKERKRERGVRERMYV
jgi:hypothetical protein